MRLFFNRSVKHKGRDTDSRGHPRGLLARRLTQVPSDLFQTVVSGVLGQPKCCLPHHRFEHFRPVRQLPFRDGEVLDGIRQIVHAALQPLLSGRPTPAVPVGVQVVGRIAERGPGDGFEVACPETLRQDDGQHAFDIGSAALQARAQPGGRVFRDRAGWGELRLHNHRLTAGRGDENIRPPAHPGSGHGLLNHARPLGVNRPVVPIGISVAQRTRQLAVRLRLCVARTAHAYQAPPRTLDCPSEPNASRKRESGSHAGAGVVPKFREPRHGRETLEPGRCPVDAIGPPCKPSWLDSLTVRCKTLKKARQIASLCRNGIVLRWIRLERSESRRGPSPRRSATVRPTRYGRRSPLPVPLAPLAPLMKTIIASIMDVSRSSAAFFRVIPHECSGRTAESSDRNFARSLNQGLSAIRDPSFHCQAERGPLRSRVLNAFCLSLRQDLRKADDFRCLLCRIHFISETSSTLTAWIRIGSPASLGKL